METTITAMGKRVTKNVRFALCSSCYWCASYLDGRGVQACLACRSGRIETIPVAGNEMYAFDYDEKRGVTVDFLPVKP